MAGDSGGNGDCPFSEKVIPYLVNIKVRGGGLTGGSNISGVAVYDVAMSTYGVLGLMLHNILVTNDRRWLSNVDLRRCLQAVESIPLDGHSQPEAWFEQCSVLRGCIADCIVDSVNRVVEVEGEQGDDCVAQLCDLTEVQIIKDLFYVLIGTRTPGDGVDWAQKTYREFSPSVKDGEELDWAPYCAMRGSSVDGCEGANDHMTITAVLFRL